jgi:membrane protein required for colicin V production
VNVADWNALDWTLIAVLLLSTWRAWVRGLVQALFGLLGFVGGFQLASWNYTAVGDWMFARNWTKELSTSRILAFLCIAISVAIVFDLVGRGMKKTAHIIGFGPVDRVLGGAFGLARGILLGVAVIVGVTAFAPQLGWAENSRLSKLFLGAAHAVSFVVPHELR